MPLMKILVLMHRFIWYLMLIAMREILSTRNGVVEVTICLIYAHGHVDINSLPHFPSDQVAVPACQLPNA